MQMVELPTKEKVTLKDRRGTLFASYSPFGSFWLLTRTFSCCTKGRRPISQPLLHPQVYPSAEIQRPRHLNAVSYSLRLRRKCLHGPIYPYSVYNHAQWRKGLGREVNAVSSTLKRKREHASGKDGVVVCEDAKAGVYREDQG